MTMARRVCGQVNMGLDGVEFAGFDQRGDGGPVCRTGIVTGEESVLSVLGDGSDGSLDGVVVHFDATVGEEEVRPTQYFVIYFNASPKGDFADARAL